MQKFRLHRTHPSEKITKITRPKNSHFGAKTIFRHIFANYRPKTPIILLLTKTPMLHTKLKQLCRNSQKKNLAGDLNANFGGKIQTVIFPVSGFGSPPNFTVRRSLGTCTRRTNPRSITSNRSKVIQEKRFSEIAKIGFLGSKYQKYPKTENPRDTVPPASYPNSICVRLPSLKKICSNVLEQIAGATTH